MIHHDRAVGTRIHAAVELYCMLMDRGVTYLRSEVTCSTAPFVIEALPQITASVRPQEDRGWLPGNYHHRKGRK